MTAPRDADAPQRYRLAWSHGAAEVLSTAAMLRRCSFEVPGVGAFRPFADAPWAGALNEAAATGLPGHMRVLGAEFVCLPFGCGGLARGAVRDWTFLLDGRANEPPHGLSADREWRCIAGDEDRLTFALDYPADHAVERLERMLCGVDGAPALALSLRVHARRKGRIPCGLHPILRLPDQPASLRIEAEFEWGLTYPAIVDPDRMLTQPGQQFDRLDTVPGRHGRPVDLSRLPTGVPCEDVVQLCRVKGPVRLLFLEEGAGVEIDWDRDRLPSLMIWLSDRALSAEPWGGRYRGLGIEPIAAAFDLAEAVSLGPNPIANAGVATALALDPAQPVTIDYRLSAFRIA